MGASEAQLRALAKARATRKQKLADERAQVALANPVVAAAVADVESESDVLRVESLLRAALDSVVVRRGDGQPMQDRCSLCEDTGVHHGLAPHCDCWCHKAREVFGGVAHAA